MISLVSGCTVSVPPGLINPGASGSNGTITERSENRNRNPIILSFTANPTNLTTRGGSITFQVDAIDEDGDTLKYSWSATGGTLSTTSGRIVSWSPPDQTGTYTVMVSVSDGRGGSAEGAQNLVVRDDGTSSTTGAPAQTEPMSGNTSSSSAAAVRGTWAKVNTPFQVTNMFVLSPDNVWIIGDDGQAAYTTNGGGRWQTLKVGQSRLTSVFFVNQSIGYIGSENGVIFTTTNGGERWELIDTGLSDTIGAIAFKDAAEGLLSTHRGIWSTSDAGKTWTQQADKGGGRLQYLADGSAWVVDSSAFSLPTAHRLSGGVWVPLNDRLERIHMVSGQRGFGLIGNKLATTDDGGRSWTVHERLKGSVEVISGTYIHGLSVTPAGDRVEIFVGNSNYVSDDGGDTWRKRGDTSIFNGSQASQVLVFPGNRGWLLYNFGLYRLID